MKKHVMPNPPTGAIVRSGVFCSPWQPCSLVVMSVQENCRLVLLSLDISSGLCDNTGSGMQASLLWATSYDGCYCKGYASLVSAFVVEATAPLTAAEVLT